MVTIWLMWKRNNACCAVLGPRTLSQVEDCPGHFQPLISVRDLQRIQQPHYIRLLLLHLQLDPPPASSCRKDTSTQGYLQKHPFHIIFFCLIGAKQCRLGHYNVCCIFPLLKGDSRQTVKNEEKERNIWFPGWVAKLKKSLDKFSLNATPLKPNHKWSHYNAASTWRHALKLAGGRVWSSTNNQSHESPAPDTQARGLIG